MIIKNIQDNLNTEFIVDGTYEQLQKVLDEVK